MTKPAQRIVVIALAVLLIAPIGAFGIFQMMGPEPQQGPSATSPVPDEERATVDPAQQPPRPRIAKPAEPAAVRERTAAGAEATLQGMLESYTYMMTTGDTSLWKAAVDPDCQVCSSFLDNAKVLHDQGGYLVGGEFEVTSATFAPDGEDSPPSSGTVTARFSQAESTLIDDPTKQGWPLDPVKGALQAQMTWDGKRWKVTDMSIAPEGEPSDAGATLAPGMAG